MSGNVATAARRMISRRGLITGALAFLLAPPELRPPRRVWALGAWPAPAPGLITFCDPDAAGGFVIPLDFADALLRYVAQTRVIVRRQ